MRLNLTSPVNSLGYGICGFNILKELVNQGHEVHLSPIGQVQADPQFHPMLGKAINSPWYKDSPSIRIYHEFDLGQHIGRPTFGFPFFELNNFTPVARHNLEQQDYVIVASQWAKGIVTSKTSVPAEKIKVVPLGVDNGTFNTSCRSQYIDPTKTIFMNIGKWEIRKGHDQLVEIFNQAFTPDDNVELVMMPHNPFLTPEESTAWENLYISSPMGNKIRLLPRVDKHEEVARIMKTADCGIFPSRAEGWNLEALEMMACGKPVILTNYSAHTEFANSENSLLVNIDELEPAFDGKWFHGDVGEWAKLGRPQIDKFVEGMQLVHQMKQEKTLDSLVPVSRLEDTAKWYSWGNTAKELIKALEV